MSALLASAGAAAAIGLAAATSAGADTPTITTAVYDASTSAAWTNSEVVGASAYDTSTVTTTEVDPTDQMVSYAFFTNGTCDSSGAVTSFNGDTWPQTVPLDSEGTISQATGPLTAGSYSFQATYSDAENSGVPSPCEPFTVSQETPSTPTITNVPTSATYGGGFTATVSTNGDGATSVSSSTTSVCTASGLSVSFMGVGTCTLTAHVAAGNDYTAADGSPQSFTVSQETPSTPTISDLPASGSYGGGFTATVSTNGDGATSVSSSTTSVCTVSGFIVSYVGAGTCTLTAHVADGTDYTAADGSPQSFTVSRATPSTPTISDLPASGSYGGGFNATVSTNGDGATSVSSSTTSVCTASGLSVSYVGVGTCTLTAHVAAGNDYAAAEGSPQSFTVSQATPSTPTISDLPASGNYGGGFNATVSTNGDGATSVSSSTTSVCTVSGLSVSYVGVGTCTLTAHLADGADYTAADGSAQEFTVAEAPTTSSVTVTTPGTYTYGETLTYQVTVKASSSGSYPASPSESAEVDVNGSAVCTAPLTTVANMDSTTGSCTSDAAPAGSSDTLSANYSGDTNYKSSSVSTSLPPVNRANTTTSVTVSNTSVPYGMLVVYTVVVAPQSPVDVETAPYLPTGSVIVKVGGTEVCTATLDANFTAICDVPTAPLGTDQAIGASYGGDSNFNVSSDTDSSQSLTVNQAPQTIAFVAPASATVGGSASLSASGGGSGNPVTLSVDPASGPEVCGVSGPNGTTVRFFSEGTCIIDANQAGNTDYLAALPVSQAISVTVPSTGGGAGGSATPVILPNADPPAGLSSVDFGTPISWVIGSGSATTVEVPIGAAKVTVTIPTGALPTNTTVSLYPVESTSPIASSLPAGKAYLFSFALSWQQPDGSVPAASEPVSVTIVDPGIVSGDVVYQVTSAGLRPLGRADKDGTLTVEFSDDPAIFIASNPRITVVGSRFVATKGTLRLTLGCPNGGCSGKAAIDEQVLVPSKSESRTKVTKEEVLLGRGSYKFGKLKRLTFHLSLGALGQSLLARAKSHPVVAVLKITVNGGRSITRTVSIL